MTCDCYLLIIPFVRLPTIESFGFDELSHLSSVSDLDHVLSTFDQIEQKCSEADSTNSASKFRKVYNEAKKKLFITLTSHEALLVLGSCKNANGEWSRRLFENENNDDGAEELFSAALR